MLFEYSFRLSTLQNYVAFRLVVSFFVFFFSDCVATEMSFGQNSETMSEFWPKRLFWRVKYVCQLLLCYCSFGVGCESKSRRNSCGDMPKASWNLRLNDRMAEKPACCAQAATFQSRRFIR